MVHKTQILIKAERHVSELIQHELPKGRHFHNLKHTQSVVLRCHEMSNFYKISTEEKMLLHLAGWFHDIGYCVSSEEHEVHSVQVMRNFLEPHLSDAQLDQIDDMIMATTLTASPRCRLEQIICDADLHHLGSHNYGKWSELLKREIEHYTNATIPHDTWARENADFFINHKYFTGFANYYWRPQKEINLQSLKEKLSVCSSNSTQPTETPWNLSREVRRHVLNPLFGESEYRYFRN